MNKELEGNKDTHIVRRVLIGTASNYAGQLVSFASLFLLTPFILHKLGATAYGLWVLVGSIVAYGSLLDFGLWGAVIKYVAEFRARGEHENARSLSATALSLYSILGLAAILLSALAAAILPHLFHIPTNQQTLASQLILLMGVGVGVSLPGLMPMAILRGLQRYDIVNLVDISATLFTTGATVAVLLLGGGVLGLVAVNICGIFLILVLSSFFVRRIAPELRIGWRGSSRSLIRTVITYSWPLFVKDIANRLQTKTDEITIGAFLPVAFVAPYNIARRLSETTQILTRQFMKVLLPLASELHAEDDLARLRSLYVTGTRLTLALSMAIGGTLIILARPILTVWVGLEYAGAASLVAILTTASFIATSQWPAGAVLQGMARHRVLAFTSMASGLTNLALSIALVRPFGLTGVALGTLIPNTLEFCIVLPFTMRIIGVSASEGIKEILLPALSPAVLMMLILQAAKQVAAPTSLLPVLAVAGFGMLVYAVGYLSLGASKAEKRTCREAAFFAFRAARTYLKQP